MKYNIDKEDDLDERLYLRLDDRLCIRLYGLLCGRLGRQLRIRLYDRLFWQTMGPRVAFRLDLKLTKLL